METHISPKMLLESQWHSQDTQNIVSLLAVDPQNGLSDSDVSSRLEIFGENQLQEAARIPAWKKFIAQFNNLIIWVLIAAAVISCIMAIVQNSSEELVDAGAIFAIVIINSILGFLQERKAEAALAALMKMSAPRANVIRNGKEDEIASNELVPGDIIYIEEGTQIPADVRILEGAGLKVNEAALTGESVASEKNPQISLPEDTPLAERINMAYSSTYVEHGRAKAVVIATGMKTEIGKIATMVSATEQGDTPLQKRLEKVGSKLVFACLVICAMVFLLGTIEGHPWQAMFLTAVALAVAAIPEGLPAVVTIALALGVERMAKRKAIMRKLASVETLGSTTVICTDKTGTLTQNHMFVKEMYLPSSDVVLIGDRVPDDLSFPLERLLVAATLCNNLYLKVGPDGRDKLSRGEVKGDATEIALVDAAYTTGALSSDYFGKLTYVAEHPFDSVRKRMSVIYHQAEDTLHTCFVKGAPESVLPLCVAIDIHNSTNRTTDVRPITGDDLESINTTMRRMSDDALRVLAVAYRNLPAGFDDSKPEEGEAELVFLGLVGMHDPARPEVGPAMLDCRTAGITPVMVTGDGLFTARAIAREVGLIDPSEQLDVIEGREVEKMSPEELQQAVPRIAVYSRVNPETKLRIVDAWQARGEIVAMTGDGVNDAPALRKADIGIAMGIRGTDVSKGAADMVLADDNFATIVHAIEEGRRIFDNIKKFIHYLLSCNTGEIVTLFLAVVFFIPMPLLPIHILWVNLVTDGLPALALGVDPTAPDIMKQNVHRRGSEILSKSRWIRMVIQGVLIGGATLAAFLIEFYGVGNGNPEWLNESQTMAFTVLVFSQLLHSLSCRDQNKSFFGKGMFANKWLLLAFSSSIAIHIAVIYVPFFQIIFKTFPLSLNDWAFTAGLSLLPFTINELLKHVWKFKEKAN